MEFIDLKAAREFSPQHHVHKSLTATPRSDITIACWEPGQTSPIHRHPGADEIYHVMEGSGLFCDGRTERRLGPGDTVIFPAGDVHQVTALTLMVLYRVQAGADGAPTSVSRVGGCPSPSRSRRGWRRSFSSRPAPCRPGPRPSDTGPSSP